MSKKHQRRDGYWRVYHLAHTRELDSLVRDIVGLVKESKPVKPKRIRRGRTPFHSWEKLVAICLIMVVVGYTFRDMQNEVPKLKLPWKEPYPDHVTIWRAYRDIPQDYIESMLEKTALICIKEADWKGEGIMASDSSGAQTDRYETVIRPNKKKKCFEEVKKRIFLKYHIVAILDHLIILRARITTYRAADSPVLWGMLNHLRAFPGSVFDADKGFDAERIFERLYELKMLPNIKQRAMQKGPKGKGRKRLRYRSRAKKEFEQELYRWRGLIEAIFGAEETDDRNKLRTRFRITEHREKWGLMLATGWNLRVLNRLRCTRLLGMEVKPIMRI